jgi:hypothetical protein
MRGVAAACCVFLMGCLVTQKKEFPEDPVCPPSIETTPTAAHPLNRIVEIDLTETGEVDGGMPITETAFDVLIRDCNASQRVEVKAFLDCNPEFVGSCRPFNESRIAPTGTPIRSFSFVLDHSAVRDPVGGGECHKVELLASGEFQFGLRDPVEAGDLGTAVWWVAVTSEPGATVDMSTCP